MRASALLLVTAALVCGCQSPEQRARAELRSRLRSDAPLSHDDVARLIGECGRAISGKTVRIHQGAVTRSVDERTRSEILGVLTGGDGVEDAGRRVSNGASLRGLKAPSTPPEAEVEATQTLWIDADTFVPRRYELTYGMPGLGDYAYDLSYDQ